MGKRYSQLDLDERIELGCLRDAGYSLRKIGKFMNRSHATVSRELRLYSEYANTRTSNHAILI
ncbi:MAG: helix-turn-helix domain-containing protein [Hyphomicrobiales bacterium]|nr:helix-turn-helix domain-containing protein [Hyphomicrobiales bacterium]